VATRHGPSAYDVALAGRASGQQQMGDMRRQQGCGESDGYAAAIGSRPSQELSGAVRALSSRHQYPAAMLAQNLISLECSDDQLRLSQPSWSFVNA
jgi:hypothetical protein